MASTLVYAPRTSRPVAASRRPSPAVYRRRRAVAGSLIAGLLAAGGVAATGALAGPGGVPASAAGAQPVVARTTVVARRGDTLWSLAEQHHGDVPFGRYLDALVSLNGGASIQAGQALVLP